VNKFKNFVRKIGYGTLIGALLAPVWPVMVASEAAADTTEDLIRIRAAGHARQGYDSPGNYGFVRALTANGAGIAIPNTVDLRNLHRNWWNFFNLDVANVARHIDNQITNSGQHEANWRQLPYDNFIEMFTSACVSAAGGSQNPLFMGGGLLYRNSVAGHGWWPSRDPLAGAHDFGSNGHENAGIVSSHIASLEAHVVDFRLETVIARIGDDRLAPGTADEARTAMRSSVQSNAGTAVSCFVLDLDAMRPVLNVSKNATVSQIAAGETISWEIEIHNPMPFEIDRIHFADLVDHPASLVQVNAPTGDNTSATRLTDGNGYGGVMDAIPANETRRINITTDVSADFPPGEQVCNQIRILGGIRVSAQSTEIAELGRSSDCVTITTPAPDIEVTPRGVRPSSEVAPNAFVYFDFNVRNIGNAAALNTRTHLTWEGSGFTFVSQTPAGGNFGTMPAESDTMVLTVRAQATGTAPGNGSCQLTAGLNVRGSADNEPSTLLRNNTAAQSASVLFPLDSGCGNMDRQTEIHRYIHHNFAAYPREFRTHFEPNFGVHPRHQGEFRTVTATTRFGELADRVRGQGGIAWATLQADILEAARRDRDFSPLTDNSDTLTQANVDLLRY